MATTWLCGTSIGQRLEHPQTPARCHGRCSNNKIFPQRWKESRAAKWSRLVQQEGQEVLLCLTRLGMPHLAERVGELALGDALVDHAQPLLQPRQRVRLRAHHTHRVHKGYTSAAVVCTFKAMLLNKLRAPGRACGRLRLPHWQQAPQLLTLKAQASACLTTSPQVRGTSACPGCSAVQLACTATAVHRESMVGAWCPSWCFLMHQPHLHQPLRLGRCNPFTVSWPPAGRKRAHQGGRSGRLALVGAAMHCHNDSSFGYGTPRQGRA